MKKLTQLQEKIPKYMDRTLPLKERKKLYKEEIEKMMNPFPKGNFKPESFEPMQGGADNEILDRVRKVPPKELPTFGLKPKEIRVGQMIGMFESKQDLYLIFAYRCNELQKEIDELKKKIEEK